jgi:hypothetical protein
MRVQLVAAPRPFLAFRIGTVDLDGLVRGLPDQMAGDVSLGARQLHLQ